MLKIMIKRALKYYLFASLWIFGYYVLRELFGINYLRTPLIMNIAFGCALLFLVPFFISVIRAIIIYFEKNDGLETLN